MMQEGREVVIFTPMLPLKEKNWLFFQKTEAFLLSYTTVKGEPELTDPFNLLMS